MPPFKTNSKMAFESRIRKIAHDHGNKIRKMAFEKRIRTTAPQDDGEEVHKMYMMNKIERNINNQMETIEDLKFLRNSFSKKSRKHGNFWGRNYDLRKNLLATISAYKIHQILEERLMQQQEQHAHFLQIQYGFYNPQNDVQYGDLQQQQEISQSQNVNVSIQELIENLSQLNQSGFQQQQSIQSEPQENEDVSIQALVENLTQLNPPTAEPQHQNETINDASFDEQIQNSSVIDEDLRNLLRSFDKV